MSSTFYPATAVAVSVYDNDSLSSLITVTSSAVPPPRTGFPLIITSAVILLLLVVCGVVGNVLVCISVYTNRSLRTANNALLVNLALADLIVCTISVPLMLVGVFNSLLDCVPLGDALCYTQTFFHVTSSTVQLTTLVAISVERYEAIVHPFETKKKRHRVYIGITLSWTIAIALAVPATITLTENSSLHTLCTCRLDESPTDYIHMAIIAPYGITCFIVVMIFYFKIFITVRKHVKSNTSTRTTDNASNNSTRASIRTVCCCFGRTNVVGSLPADVPRIIPVPVAQERPNATGNQIVTGEQPQGVGNAKDRTDEKDVDSQDKNGIKADTRAGLAHTVEPITVGSTGRSATSSDTGVGLSGLPNDNGDQRDPSDVTADAGDIAKPKGLLLTISSLRPSVLPIAIGAEASTPTVNNSPGTAVAPIDPGILPNATKRMSFAADIQGSVCVLNPELRVRGRRNLEAKTAKRASYIIAVFSLCWIPLFVVTYLETSAQVAIFVVCIAAMSAALNPIVYTVVNKSFRTEFGKLLHVKRLRKRCPCLGST